MVCCANGVMKREGGSVGSPPGIFLKNCTFSCNLGAGLLPFGALGQYPSSVFGTLHVALKRKWPRGVWGFSPRKIFENSNSEDEF